jgi:molybdenum cofactor cytidylyltransferase
MISSKLISSRMISSVILAAGASRRMGRPKQLVRLGGKTVLRHVLDSVRASTVNEIVVVLGHNAKEVAATLAGGEHKIVINPQFSSGMSSSIRRGLGAVDARAEAVLIVLGDQPYVSTGIIDRLVQEYAAGSHQIVVPTCGGRRGHPVIFGRKYWPELQALRGDVGGKDLLRRHAEDVLEVEVEETGILVDIDRPEDGLRSLPQDEGRANERAGKRT